MMVWEFLHPNVDEDSLGFIPFFFNDEDPRSAKEQIDTAYVSGWNSFHGFKMDPQTQALKYPDDPELPVLARAMMRDEQILFYDCAWVAIRQKDGSFEVARID